MKSIYSEHERKVSINNTIFINSFLATDCNMTQVTILSEPNNCSIPNNYCSGMQHDEHGTEQHEINSCGPVRIPRCTCF